MPGLQTIRADGVEWPLATFLDAYGYRHVDQDAPPAVDGGARFATVTVHGELQPPRFASDIPWWDTLAFRPIEHATIMCRGCHMPICYVDGGDDLCDRCDDGLRLERGW